MDFAFLPPEINSTRMYTGAGPGPLLAAAASWDSLSAELGIAAGVYESVLSGLTSLHWKGPTSQAMSAAATPYLGWLHTTAEQAQQTAMQARAAAAAYELAHAMTVPPAAVAANRTQLSLLIATNFFGQNAPAIAATEAQYGEYWAQDATAMYGYATNAAATTQLTPFSSPHQITNPSPHQITNPAGMTAQNAAVAQANAGAAATSPASQAVSAATPTSAANLPLIPTDLTILNVIQAVGTAFNGTWKMEATPTGIIGAEKDLGVLPKLAAPTGLGGAGLGGAGLGNVNAVLAGAGKIDSLSVPASWTANSPITAPVTARITAPITAPVTALSGGGSGSGMAGIPGMPGGTISRATGIVPRYGARITVMARPPAAG